MFFEFFYAAALSLSRFAVFIEVIGAIGLLVCLFIVAIPHCLSEFDYNYNKEKREKDQIQTKIYSKFIVKYLIILVIVFAPFALIPDTDDLWKIRIGFIKLQLASPKNLEKGTEEIGRIAKKLECKYLGGCEEEKPKEKGK